MLQKHMFKAMMHKQGKKGQACTLRGQITKQRVAHRLGVEALLELLCYTSTSRAGRGNFGINHLDRRDGE